MADGGSGLQDDELYLPRSKSSMCGLGSSLSFHAAVVNKLIKEIVPNIRVSTDARDLLLNCCTGQYLYELTGINIKAKLKNSTFATLVV